MLTICLSMCSFRRTSIYSKYSPFYSAPFFSRLKILCLSPNISPFGFPGKK